MKDYILGLTLAVLICIGPTLFAHPDGTRTYNLVRDMEIGHNVKRYCFYERGEREFVLAVRFPDRCPVQVVLR